MRKISRDEWALVESIVFTADGGAETVELIELTVSDQVGLLVKTYDVADAIRHAFEIVIDNTATTVSVQLL